MYRSIGMTLVGAALLVGCGSTGPGSSTGPTPGPGFSGASVVPAQDYEAGKNAFGTPPTDASTRGQWSGLIADWPTLAIHTTLLPDGKVMTFGGNNYTDWKNYAGQTTIRYNNKIDLWDPSHPQPDSSAAHSDISFVGDAIFCGGHTVLPDGRLLITGGDDLSKLTGQYSYEAGIRAVNIYDYRNKTWSKGKDMKEKRWYPTNLVLPDGDVLVMGGNRENNNDLSDLPEVFDPESGNWRALTGAVQKTEFYPWLFNLSDGRVINVGGGIPSQVASQTSTGIYDTAGAGKFTVYDRGDNRFRDYGTAVMFETDKMLVLGGGGDSNTRFNPRLEPPTNTALVVTYDPNTKQASKGVPTGSMAVARRHAVATMLPDGTVLVTGGTSGLGFSDYKTAVLTTELWNPATGRFSQLAPMGTARVYHATALLLPDASVLVSGGGAYSEQPTSGYNTYRNAQIFKPPYLFKGPRPTIQGVSSAVIGYDQTFEVSTPDAGQIDQVRLIRLGSVTHAFNMNQQTVELTRVAQANGKLTLRAPQNSRLAAPGQYMLFILKNGVPSVSRIITLK